LAPTGISILQLVPALNQMDVLIPKKKWSFVTRLKWLGPLVLAGTEVVAEARPAATCGGQPAFHFLFHPLAVAAMNAIIGCFFRWVTSLALLVLLLSSTQASSAQTLAGQPSYQATGLRTLIKAQPNSALVRVRYESNNPGPVQLELLDDKGGVVYTERKQETHFVGNYDLAHLPAGDYALHLATYGFHHVEALRLHRANNSVVTVQVIRPDAFRIASSPLVPSVVTN
jgi:hypothetical protein